MLTLICVVRQQKAIKPSDSQSFLTDAPPHPDGASSGSPCCAIIFSNKSTELFDQFGEVCIRTRVKEA